MDSKCPDCKELLVLRNGPYGIFLGCSAFPKCRWSMTIREPFAYAEETQWDRDMSAFEGYDDPDW